MIAKSHDRYRQRIRPKYCRACGAWICNYDHDARDCEQTKELVNRLRDMLAQSGTRYVY